MKDKRRKAERKSRSVVFLASITSQASSGAADLQSADLNEGCRTSGLLLYVAKYRRAPHRSFPAMQKPDPCRQGPYRSAQNRRVRHNGQAALIAPSTHQVSSALRLSFPP